MKKIIVPIDYSVASKNALNYAIKIAPVLNLSIEVVYAYSGLFNVSEKFVIRAGMNKEEALLYDMDYLINLGEGEETVAMLPAIKIEKRLLQGIPNIEIVKLSEEEDCAMIVMGTTGSHNAVGKFFGSTSTEVARNANCPVILVPKEAKFTGIKHILFSSNYESTDSKVIKGSMNWANNFKANIHFVHIVEEGDGRDFDESRETIIDTIFEGKAPSVAFEIKNIYAHSVGDGLHNYIEEKNIDLLVMVAPKKSFLQNIFHKSRTKEMAYSTKIPMVVYHN